MKDGAHLHDKKDKYGLHGHEQYEGKISGAVIESKSTTKKVGNKTITTRITKIINKIRKQKKRTRKMRKRRHR